MILLKTLNLFLCECFLFCHTPWLIWIDFPDPQYIKNKNLPRSLYRLWWTSGLFFGCDTSCQLSNFCVVYKAFVKKCLHHWTLLTLANLARLICLHMFSPVYGDCDANPYFANALIVSGFFKELTGFRDLMPSDMQMRISRQFCSIWHHVLCRSLLLRRIADQHITHGEN